MSSTRNSKLEIRNTSDGDGPLLSAKDVQMSFGGLMALNNFSLDLAPGELHGLIGPNGAGKTTVFNLLTGFYRPSEGEISFIGAPIIGLPPQLIARRGIARTFQNIRLFTELSVLDNVLLSFHSRSRSTVWQAVLRSPGFRREESLFRQRALEILELFNLQDYFQVKAERLPYGQQRRLELARALAAAPRLLLLDEPAAGLNPQETADLIDLLQNLQQHFDLTMLLIEHNIKFVMGICQRLTVLDHGLTIAQGPPAFIRSHPLVIKAYLGEAASA